VRGLAFLMVFGVHYLALPWGWAGVDVFFVLSGFLITGILFDTRDDPHRARNFYVRRTLRIFPLYYGVMLLLVLSYPIFRWEWSWGWLAWPAYLGNFIRVHRMTSGSGLETMANAVLRSRTFPGTELSFGHFWSLCVEEQFYLVWPWVVFLVRDRRKLLWVCGSCVVVCPLLRIVGSHILPQYLIEQEALYYFTPFRVDALLLGGWVALVRRGPSRRALLLAARFGFAALSVALLLWLALVPSARHLPQGYVYPAWWCTWAFSFIDLYAACLVVLVLQPASIAFRVFNLPALRWVGRISYGAYVFHAIFRREYNGIAISMGSHAHTLTVVFGLGSTLLMAWASFRWFETPFIRLKDRLAR
jgi:peptidoglycan/LPS O-acetylase OafA/YrhL